jgi:hypothetical protein
MMAPNPPAVAVANRRAAIAIRPECSNHSTRESAAQDPIEFRSSGRQHGAFGERERRLRGVPKTMIEPLAEFGERGR